ncbi:MAG: lipopolysaccharide biosynthesis protein [Bacteroidota bacterium]
MATESIKSSAISAVKWSTISQIGSYGITFVLSIILARLLDPSEFGLTGMLSIFTGIAVVFINSGLSTAIIRTKDASLDDYSTVFYFNIAVSTAFYLLFFFTAPLIAAFYKEPILIPLTRLITLVFLINSFGIIQNAILIKEINFKKQTICNLIGLVASVIVSAIMAFNSYGVYSIVGQAISQAFVTNLLLWISSKWRPSGRFSKSSFMKLWQFGSKVLATTIVAQIIDNLDNLLIGKIFSAGQLGYYVRAKSTKQLPEQIFSSVMSTTSFAVLAKMSDNDSEFRRVHMHFFKLGAYIFIPVIIGFIAVAKSFIVVLYSDKWLPSVPLFQIIALSSFAYFFGVLFSQTIIAKGAGKLYFRLTTGKKILGLLSMPFGLFWGLIPFLCSFVVISMICLTLDIYFTGKLINVSIFDYLLMLFKPIITSAIMGLVVYLITFLPISSLLIVLTLQVFIGVIVYILLSVIFKTAEFLYIKQLVMDKLHIRIKSYKNKKG